MRRPAGPSSVDEYLARVPPKFLPTIEWLRSTIRSAAPHAEEIINYQLPAFHQDGNLVYDAAFKDHVSLFVGSFAVRRKLAQERRPFLAGAGTLHFTPEHRLPATLVRRIVRARLEENAARQAAKSSRTSPPTRAVRAKARRPRRA